MRRFLAPPLLASVLLALPEPALAAYDPTATAALDYRQHTWNREHGLPDDTVLSLLEGRDGCVWIGTGEGLVRFDGIRFLVFDRVTCPDFTGTEVRSLAETPDGNIWLATPQGLWALEPTPRPILTPVAPLATDSIRILEASRAGDLWVATDDALYQLTDAGCSKAPLDLDPKPGEPVILDLAEDTAGTIWMATRRGLFRRATPHGVVEPDAIAFTNSATPSHSPARLAPASNGALWLVGHGADRFHLNAVEPAIVEARLLPNDDLLSALATRGGELWLGFERTGLWRWRDGLLTTFTRDSGLPANWVNCLLEDREGNLWFGMENGGVACLLPRRFRPLTRAHGLPDESVWALTPARRGGVWIGTDGGVVWSSDGGQVQSLPGLSLTNPKVRALHETPDGTLWIGTGDSLEAWRDGRLDAVRWEAQAAANKVRVITSDRHGRLWVGRESGLMRLDRWGDAPRSQDQTDRLDRVSPHPPQPLEPTGGWLHFTTAHGLPHNDVRALLESPSGHLWVGTFGGGLCRLSATASGIQVERVLTEADGLPGRFVWALHQDAEGVLWAGTDLGLARVTNADGPADQPARIQVTAFTHRSGLASQEVNHILEDDSGHLWLSSDDGLARVRKAELEAFAVGQLAAIHPITYDEADGLLSRETNGQKSQPAGCKTSDGRLWFPTTRGVAIVDPARFLDATNGPPARIEKVIVDGQTLLDTAEPPGTPSPRWGDALRSQDQPSRWGDAPRSQDQTDRLDGVSPHQTDRLDGVSPHRRGNAERTAADFQLPPGRARVLEIHYTAPEFRAAEKVRFRYRLEGWDRGWVDAANRRAAFYTNLRPGRYRFEVQAASNGNRWGAVSAPFTFRLAPYLHQAVWFWPTVVVAAGLLAWTGVTWRLRDLKSRHAIQRENALALERQRIARDMHDDIGARLNHLALLSDPLLSPGVPSEVTELAREAIRSLDTIVWASQSAKDTLPHLVSYLSHTANEHAAAAGLALELDLPEHLPPWPLAALERHHLFLATREAIHNAIRHAHASHLLLRVSLGPQAFTIEVQDDGCGFDLPGADSRGNGFANMRERLKAIGARFRLESQPGHGTRLQIECDGERFPGKGGRSPRTAALRSADFSPQEAASAQARPCGLKPALLGELRPFNAPMRVHGPCAWPRGQGRFRCPALPWFGGCANRRPC